MTWQFVNRFAETSSACLWNFFSSRGCLAAIVVILAGFHCWKRVSNWWWRRARLIKFSLTLPGPRSLPIIGNALEFACNCEDTLERIVDICSPYESPFRIWLGPKLFIVTTEPRDYEAWLFTQTTQLLLTGEIILGSGKAAYKDTIYRVMEPFIGQGLVSGSGAKHKAHRKIIMPMLNSKTLSMYLKHFDRHSRTCADLLEKEVGKGEFDISSYMAHCTIDIMLDTIMGSPGTTQKNDYEELFYWTERIYGIIHTRMMKAWLHYDKVFFHTQLGKDHDKGLNVIHSFVENVIERKKKDHRAVERTGGDPERPRFILLEQLIAHVEKANDMDDVELRDEIYTIFTAAQDTSSVISSFAFLMLAMHPEIQNKVRDEANEILGNEDIQEKHLQNLKYLEMVIRETIRLFPIAPLMVRQLKGDLKLGERTFNVLRLIDYQESCTLPEGCSVVMVPFVTHRNPKYWREPEKFVPERFLPENSKGRHQCANLSFSGGLRGCIGQKFAIMCLKTIIANVVRRYRLSSNQRLESLQLKTDISIRSRNGYKLSLTKID